MSSLGLVLSGGGARGAYQAGALVAIAEICKELRIENPFQIYTGVSAGAINIAFLTADLDGFISGTQTLTKLWSNIQSEDVFLTDAISLSKIGLELVSELSLGGAKKASPGRSLLNTSPLGNLISKNCNFENIQKNIDNNRLRGVAISAMDYSTTSTVSFTQAHSEVPMWTRVRRHSETCLLEAKHIIASASIPLIFPPVEIENRFFGDGCIRNLSPCGPAIYMGAEKLLAIGVRKRQDMCYSYDKHKIAQAPTIARVVNVLLNAIMMDGMEMDLERVDRINEGISKLEESQRKHLQVKRIEYIWISPSFDLAEIAVNKSDKLPRMLRYLLKGLGSIEEASEVVSYLLFEASYAKRLIDIGYEDTMKQKKQLEHFLTT
jgi:NTE family protein